MSCKGPNQDKQQVCIAVEVDLADPDNFLFAYIQERDSTGIFVRTTNPEAPGTRLEVHIATHDHRRWDALDSAAEHAGLVIDGLVAWVNPYRPDDNDNLSPGMAVRLVDVSREQRARLIGLSKCITYIDDESRIGESGDAVVAPIASGDSGPAGSPAL